jgi:hypothetical protein
MSNNQPEMTLKEQKEYQRIIAQQDAEIESMLMIVTRGMSVTGYNEELIATNLINLGLSQLFHEYEAQGEPIPLEQFVAMTKDLVSNMLADMVPQFLAEKEEKAKQARDEENAKSRIILPNG